MSEDADRLLATPEAAEQLGFSEATLRQWRWQQRGPKYLKVHGHQIRYRQSDLDAWVEAQKVEQ